MAAMSAPKARLAAALVLLLVGAWLDRGSVERANRLQRRGDLAAAIELYRGRRDSLAPVLRYNLGTAWLGAGSPREAEPRLAAGRAAEDPEVRFRSEYNLGSLLLAEGLALADPVMAAQLAGEALLAFRGALRVDPDSDDARWNLAIAMRVLDSLEARAPGAATGIPTRADAAGLDERGGVRGGVLDESGEATLLEGGLDAESLEAARLLGGGARETRAEEGERGASTPEEIRSVLATVEDDVSGLLRRILWFLGPRGPRDPLGERTRRTGEW